MSQPYGHRVYIHNLQNGEVISYCVVGHNFMIEAIAELKLQLKLKDNKKYSLQCIGYQCMKNYDKLIEATWEYYYEEEDFGSN